MLAPLVALGAIGVLQDFLITRYYLAITARRLVVAPALGVLITVLTVLVFSRITQPGHIVEILSYGIGTGAGTLLGMVRRGMSGGPNVG